MTKPDIANDTLEQLETLVDRWFHESFHGSLVARATDVWNHVQAAKDDLKCRLARFLVETTIG